MFTVILPLQASYLRTTSPRLSRGPPLPQNRSRISRSTQRRRRGLPFRTNRARRATSDRASWEQNSSNPLSRPPFKGRIEHQSTFTVMDSPLHVHHRPLPVFWVYPGFSTLFWGLSVFFVGDLMGKALWKLVENAARFPRRGGRVLCVHGAVSFHRARPCGPRWLTGRGAMRHVELDRRVLGLQSTDE